ncbi:cholesterol 24-hydroxylase-like [Protopterus annectens]|uniref:cholesterol 24-hydroxylase-like n=1 Tax=Protopterus annectens TaxID=7888 RepID=UPI001CF9D6DA|nr:cholesterol 24-hydroxylase-like [Protopterus annectens]
MEFLTLCTRSLLLLLFLTVMPFLLFCCYIKYIHFKYDYIPGPPRISFLFGHLPIFDKLTDEQKNTHEVFLQWAEIYGPVYRINALHKLMIFVTDPEAVKEILMSPKYQKAPEIYKAIVNLFGVRLMGNGLVTALDYNHWHKQRRIMDPAFSRPYLISLMGTFNDVAEHLMEKLEEKSDGKTEVSLHNMFSRVTLDVITKTAFGMENSSLNDVHDPFPHAIFMVMKGIMLQIRKPFTKFFPKNNQLIQEIRQSALLLRHAGQECIRLRKAAIQNGEEIPKDILTQILKCAELEENIDEEAMLDNFITFFVAGQETTANQLSFTVMELTRHPEILKRLQEEVDEVVGLKKNIEHEDLNKLQYMSQVLKESLRLYPPAPTTNRILHKEMMLDGIKVPANVALTFDTYVMGRMEKFFKDPLTFNPDRFSPDTPKPYYCYFPFSLGPRSCIGLVFAQMEAKLVLAKLLQRFEFEYVSNQSYEIMDIGSLKPRDGVVCRIKQRVK